jgi:uncharacterized protein (DUF2252 family)
VSLEDVSVDHRPDGAPSEERNKAGRLARARVPRSSHADWRPPADRPNVVDFLRDADRGRIADLLPLRYTRMAASPFAFFRGAAPIMARDLSSTPTTGWHVQASGDAHLANFGTFATPERALVFDLNDFDETSRGPWEWDLKRLATSVMLVGRANGLASAACSGAVIATARSYRLALSGYAAAGYLATFYAALDAARVLKSISVAQRPVARQELQRATHHDQLGALAKLTAIVDGRPRIIDRPPLVTHLQDDDPLSRYQALREAYTRSVRADVRELLQRYAYVDAARKVVGVGSVGTRCFIVLLTGRSAADPLFLQVKEARPSVLEPYVGAAAFSNHGERVVDGQRRIQAASDIFLGWGEQDGTHYYVRQLQDMKGAVDLARLKAGSLATYSALCGWALARAHARSGDPVRLAGYLGRGDAMDQAIVRFAGEYADQTERDHATFAAAVKDEHLVPGSARHS